MPTYLVAGKPVILWNTPDPVPDEVYASIAAQVKAGSNPTIDISAAALSDHLRSRHVMYWKQTPMQTVNGQIVDWGDCGQPGSSGVPTGGLTAVSDVGTGIAAGVGVSGAAVGALGGPAAAAAAGLGFLNVVPVVGTIAAVALLPFEIILSHHAAAVAKEQGDNCACWLVFNQWLDSVDNAVATGQILPADGATAVQQLYAQATECVSPVSKPCDRIGDTNAACDLKGVAEGLVLLRQWMYSNLPQFMPASDPLSGVLGGGSSAPGSGVQIGGLGLVALAVLIAVLVFRR